MKKILIINNDFDTMTLLQSWLEKKGYAVKITGNASEVIKTMKEFDPELVIIDVLQNIIIANIKKDVQTRHVPLLLMTGYTLRKYNNRFSVDDTIEKPFDLNLLEKKVKNLVGRNEPVE